MPKIQKNKKKNAQKFNTFSIAKTFKNHKILTALAVFVALPAVYLGVNSFEHQTFAGTINIGTDTVLPSTTQQAATYKGATQYSVSQTGTIDSVTMYMDGKGGSRGSQVMQMAVYSDNNGNPGSLMGSSATQTVTAGTAATWKNFPLTSTVSVTAGTKIWLSSFSPSGSSIVRIFGDSAAGYKSIYNVNSGSTPSSTFGSGTSYTGRQSYYAIETLSSTTPTPTPTPPSPTPTPTPTPTPSGTPSAALSVWKTSLGNTVNAPAKWVAIGESLTEGQGASTISKRWLNLDRDKLRTNYTTTSTTVGGENYIPAIYRVYAPDSLWSKPYINAKGTLTPVYWPGNLGYRAVQFSRGAAATYPVTGDSADLWYVAGTSGGSFSYKVDNGSAITVNTYSSTYNASARIPNISLGTTGSHNITITSTSGSPVFSGISVFKGDRTTGIQVYDTSYSGATVSVYLADLAQFHQTVASVAPQLVTIELGGNDYENGTDPAVFKSQLLQLINDLKTLPNVPSIMLVPPYQCYTSSPTKYPYSAYVQAAKDIAAADPDHVTTYALSDYFPAGDTSGKGYYRTDGIHPNDTGQTVISNLIYGAITQ